MLSRISNTTFVKPLGLSVLIIAALGTSFSASADTSYGPVKPRDTLSKIVKRLYTGNRASQQSVMRQIVADNPRAFSNGDMNRLKLNATLSLRGDFWKGVVTANSNQTIIASTAQDSPVKIARQEIKSQERLIVTDSVDRAAPELSVEQMKGRIVFLDAERSSLMREVQALKQETARLERKVDKLESASKQSDEQLRTLDAEIIRLTELLGSKGEGVTASNAELNQLVVLQEKLRLVQKETNSLRTELVRTQKKLTNNDSTSRQTDATVTKLTQENQKLQKLLQDAQPGVHYYNDSASSDKLSFMAGKFQLPLGLVVVGSALMALMLIALVATRRKKKIAPVDSGGSGINPFEDNQSFSQLLETENHESRGYAQLHTHPEENVFKMFDDGSLEMDLKLDMAEAYLEVSDMDSARDILHEVVASGSELQKRKAKGLINRAA